MSFGELLGGLLGWLGTFVEWLFGWAPTYLIIRSNERGVHFFMGREPVEWLPGSHWYVPNLSQVEVHHNNRMVLYVEPLALETADEHPCEVGLVVTYHIIDVVVFEAANYDADESMVEVAQGALQDIVTSSEWSALRGKTSDGSRLGKKLARGVGTALARFGVEVESARPTHQVRLRSAHHLFGIPAGVELDS